MWDTSQISPGRSRRAAKDLWVQLPGSRSDLRIKKNVAIMGFPMGSEFPVPEGVCWVGFYCSASLIQSS